MVSAPSKPRMTLPTALPRMESEPEPPMAFSIVTPSAIETFPVRPPTSEKSPALRSIFWAFE